MSIEFRLKRIYEEPSEADGLRLLADRLWPRGVSKEDAQLDLWPKELTPSNELRKWFHEDDSRREEFVKKYRKELNERKAQVQEVLDSFDKQVVTLLTATKHPEQGHVPVLKEYLEGMVNS